jgi:hypothetical protein
LGEHELSKSATVRKLHPLQERDVRFFDLTADEAMEHWEKLAPYLEMSFKYSAGRMNIQAVKDNVEQGMSIVMVAYDYANKEVFAVLAAEGINYPERKVFSVGLCGGKDIDVWAPTVWAGLVRIAIEKGCDQIEIVGRRGWKKFIPGVEEIATWYAMDLDTPEEGA